MNQKIIFVIIMLVTIIANCKEETGKDNLLLPLLNQKSASTSTNNSKEAQPPRRTVRK